MIHSICKISNIKLKFLEHSESKDLLKVQTNCFGVTVFDSNYKNNIRLSRF